MSELKWIDRSNSYDGKQLKTAVKIDDDTILDCALYYRQYIPADKSRWDFDRTEIKKLGYETVLHVAKMRRGNNCWTGGIGKFVSMETATVSRKTLKWLQEQSELVTHEKILQIGTPQTTEPSRII